MIERYGWSEALQRDFQPFAAQGLSPARVIVQQRGRHRLVAEAGEFDSELSGRFAFDAGAGGHPVAGDWVAAALRPEEGAATIHAVLPRRTTFMRKAAGRATRPQIIAANIDVALLVSSLNGDLSPRRMERFLAAALESGAEPVIVLTKADLCADAADHVATFQQLAPGVAVHAISALTGAGIEDMRTAIGRGRTAVLLGSSGVGKSTLLNALAGEDLMVTQAIRSNDETGRHTTTHRELVLLPDGALLLDTPGMREFGLLDAEEGVSATFEDVEALAAACRFHDCGHTNEPGCAIQAALVDGSLSDERWQGYGKLQRELAHGTRKEDWQARDAHRRMWMGRHKAYRQRVKFENQKE